MRELPEVCEFCEEYPAAIRWFENGGALEFSHGWWKGICQICALEKQIVHAEERCAALPGLREQLEAAKTNVRKVSDDAT